MFSYRGNKKSRTSLLYRKKNVDFTGKTVIPDANGKLLLYGEKIGIYYALSDFLMDFDITTNSS